MIWSPPRSLLFVPADQPRRLARAWVTDVDAVIADLEDAVAPDVKATARTTLAEHVASAGPPRAPLWVRINGLETEHAQPDLELVADLPATAVLVPKAAPRAVAALAADLPIVALVETAAGLLDAAATAALPGVAQLMLGTVDLAADAGVDMALDSPLFAHARASLAIASAAAALPGPIDGVWTDLSDLDGMRHEAMLARANGFSGKACIHPDQIPIARDVFTPSARTLTEMRRLVATADEAARAGSGVTVLDGRMVDRPVVDRARRVLEMAEATDRAAQERRTHKESNL